MYKRNVILHKFTVTSPNQPTMIHRRGFIRNMGLMSVIPCLGGSAYKLPVFSSTSKAKFKLSCNLYSFNKPLSEGTMTLEEVIDFCADLGFDAIDPTGYYFPGYPEVPDDDYIYHIKRKAFLQGLAISGTGIRNDFTQADKRKREADIALIRNWVPVAAKLDAPVLRIFAGHDVPEGHAEEVFHRVVEDIKTCVNYAAQQGVIIVLQNHNGLLKTAGQVLQVLEQIDSGWFGLNLDIGSLRTGDPYAEIAELAPYAYTWQIKENVYREQKMEKTDLNRIARILRESGYRGYLPIETLGTGDPKEKVPRFLEEVRSALQ